MGRDHAAHDVLYLVLAEWESWAAGMIHNLCAISGSVSPVRMEQKGEQGFLESTLLSLSTCTVPIHTEIQHIQPHQTSGAVLSKCLKFQPNICWETSSAPRPRQTSVFRAMRVRWGELLCWGTRDSQMLWGSLRSSLQCTPATLLINPCPSGATRAQKPRWHCWNIPHPSSAAAAAAAPEFCWVWEVLEHGYLVWTPGRIRHPGYIWRAETFLALLSVSEQWNSWHWGNPCGGTGQGEQGRARTDSALPSCLLLCRELGFSKPTSRDAHPELGEAAGSEQLSAGKEWCIKSCIKPTMGKEKPWRTQSTGAFAQHNALPLFHPLSFALFTQLLKCLV